MISSYIKLILRNLKRRSLFSILNVSGLAIGLASVLVIISYVRDELSYDQFHRKHEQIYRITLDWMDDGRRTHMAAVEPPLAEALNGRLTSVERLVRIYPIPGLVSVDRVNKTKETGFCYVDSVFFEMFDFEFLHGDVNTALLGPMSIVLTQTKAVEYFGRVNVVGEDLYYETDRQAFTFHVTGVIKDFPRQSHFSAGFLASFHSMDNVMPWYNSWYYPQMHTYVLVRPGTDLASLQQQINVEAKKSHPPQVKEGERTYYLQKMTDIHLYSKLQQEWHPNSDINNVYLFVTIGGFILLIASINFMNLSTSLATTRAKEVGLRKVMGAYKRHLVTYFIGEAVFISLLSFVLGFALAEWVLLGGLNEIIGRKLTLNFMMIPEWSVVILVSLFILGILSGLYPAFFLSRFKPVHTLKGAVDKPGREITLRKGMVVFQFVISAVLLIFTWIVLDQNSFMLNKNLGFDKEHVIGIYLNDSEAKKNYNVLKNKLLEAPGVIAVALSSALPGNDEFHGFTIKAEGRMDEIAIKTLGVDEDYLSTYGMKLLAGRDFSRTNKADEEGAFIINQAAARNLGWDDPIGKELTFIRYTNGREERPGKVIGLVENFHYQSLHHNVEPLIIYINRHLYFSDYLSVRFNEISPVVSVKMLQQVWKDFIPDKPLEFVFIESQLDEFYYSEVRRANILSSFAGLSIFVSCLGLFGLAAFSMQQRRREIGIRKVLGASMGTLLASLTGQFLKLVFIANLIAWPITWYISSLWLQNFAYHVTPGLDIFILSALATAAIAVITISFQTIKASIINPVEVLKED